MQSWTLNWKLLSKNELHLDGTKENMLCVLKKIISGKELYKSQNIKFRISFKCLVESSFSDHAVASALNCTWNVSSLIFSQLKK